MTRKRARTADSVPPPKIIGRFCKNQDSAPFFYQPRSLIADKENYMRGDFMRAAIVRRRTYPLKLQQAIDFRKTPTPAEDHLWQSLRGNRLSHLHFRRQHVLEGFIVDFYCHKARLVIEVDEQIHASQQEQNEARDEFLATRGLRTLRVTDDDIMNRMDEVCDRIAVACKWREEL